MTLASLSLGNTLEDHLNVVSTTAPGSFSALATSCSAAHIFYRAQSLLRVNEMDLLQLAGATVLLRYTVKCRFDVVAAA